MFCYHDTNYSNCRDFEGKNYFYQPIAIVDYQGNFSTNGDNETSGHYTCDVRDKTSNMWFRTNDDCVPVQISQEEMTKNAYLVLYEKM